MILKLSIYFLCMQIKKQKQQLRDIKAGRLLPPGQNLEEEDEEEDEEELEEVKEFEPTDRRPTIFDTEKGESHVQGNTLTNPLI